MKKIIAIKDLDDMKVIKWRITEACNYHCSYCIRRPLVEKANPENIKAALAVLPDVINLAERLANRHNMKVKIDLIGGEVSLHKETLDIVKGLGDSEAIGKINITTNLSQPVDWYLDLIDKSKKKISITASFHPEYADLDEFLEKAFTLSKVCQFKAETVITAEANHIDKFVAFCESHNMYYMCEENLFDPSLRGQAKKNIKEVARYQVTFDDGTEEYFNTRNEVIKTYGTEGMLIDTTEMKCSRDYDYIYIERDEVLSCTSSCHIRDFRLYPRPHPCPRGKCTLCGHMTLS